MEKCLICGNLTDETAPFYAGVSVAEGEHRRIFYTRHTQPCCTNCVVKAHKKGSGLLCYVTLQLLWFVTARSGIASLPGLAAALTATLALIRLLFLLLRRYWPSSSHMPALIWGKLCFPEESSDLILDIVKQMPEFAGAQILSQREYQRLHSH